MVPGDSHKKNKTMKKLLALALGVSLLGALSPALVRAADADNGAKKRARPTEEQRKLRKELIEKYDTAVVPGRFFESPQHIRIGMCCDPDLFSAGVERLGKALDQLGG